MSVARSLEKRLERLIDGVAGRLFSGRLHPAELAGKLAREADFARFDHVTGPATANLFVIQMNPRDIGGDPSELERTLAAELSAYTSEEGLRLEGPVEVRVQGSDTTAPGKVNVHVEVAPGPPVVWARLVSQKDRLGVGRNRAIIGRGSTADVTIPHDDISRRHALIYREAGQIWLRDLASANGTYVDGVRLDQAAAVVQPGSIVAFSEHRYRLVEK